MQARCGTPSTLRLCTGEQDGSHGSGRSPDTEVRAAGVVASHRGHPARVRADVARPGLGDVKGAVGIHAHAWDGVHVDGGSLLLPDVPEREARLILGCDKLQKSAEPLRCRLLISASRSSHRPVVATGRIKAAAVLPTTFAGNILIVTVKEIKHDNVLPTPIKRISSLIKQSFRLSEAAFPPLLSHHSERITGQSVSPPRSSKPPHHSLPTRIPAAYSTFITTAAFWSEWNQNRLLILTDIRWRCTPGAVLKTASSCSWVCLLARFRTRFAGKCVRGHGFSVLRAVFIFESIW